MAVRAVGFAACAAALVGHAAAARAVTPDARAAPRSSTARSAVVDAPRAVVAGALGWSGWRARIGARGALRVASGPAAALLAVPAPDDAELDWAARRLIDARAVDFGVDAAALADGAVARFGRHALVTYRQRAFGAPVVGARVKLLFDGPRLALVSSTAVALAPPPAVALDRAAALAVARPLGDGEPTVLGEVIFPRAGAGGALARRAYRVALPSDGATHELLIDAHDGAVLERRARRVHAAVQVVGTVDGRDADTTVERALPLLADLGGDADGWGELAAAATVELRGPRVRLFDAAAPIASLAMTPPGESAAARLGWPPDAPLDQIAGWVFGHEALAYGDRVVADLPWLGQPLRIYLNVLDGAGAPSTCNAFYTPRIYADEDPGAEGLHFFSAGDGCVNTGRKEPIVLHEWGHGLHDHLLPGGLFDGSAPYEVEGSISEGVGDYVAATIIGSPVMPLSDYFPGADDRLLDNDLRYPDDLRTLSEPGGQRPAVHWNGQIWSGAFWHLREELVARYGVALGARMADRLHADALRTGPGWDDVYETLIALDDDDGDPTNGSPHSCAINAALGRHGLAPDPRPATPSPRIGFTGVEGGAARFTLGGCGAPTGVELVVDLAGETLRVAATVDGERVAAELPARSAGQAARFHLEGRLEGGVAFRYPTAGQLSIEDVGRPLERWDFEDGDGGFRHGGDRAAVDDWQIGAPGDRVGDPPAARSGARIAATDLGDVGDGLAAAGERWLAAPPVSCDGCPLWLRLASWLDLAPGDEARIEVNGEVAWRARGEARDPDWQLVELDLRELTTGVDPVELRFVVVAGAGGGSGWSLDDVSLYRAAGDRGPGDVDDGSTIRAGCAAGGRPPGAGLLLVALALLTRWAAGAARRAARS